MQGNSGSFASWFQPSRHLFFNVIPSRHESGIMVGASQPSTHKLLSTQRNFLHVCLSHISFPMAFPVFTSSQSTYYSRFRWIFLGMSFFLLASLGNAAWNTEYYCCSYGTRHEPRSSAETRQSRAATTEFITRKDLQEFQKQIDNFWECMGVIDHSTFHDLEFPNELDIVFEFI